MIETEVLINMLIGVALFIGMQITKTNAPDFMDKHGRWATLLFGTLGAFVSIAAYLAAHNGHIVVENNNWEAVIIVLVELLKGFGVGIMPAGIYNAVRPLTPNVVRSTDEILAGKAGVVTTHTIDLNVASEKDLKVAGVELTENKETEVVGNAEVVTLKAKTPKKGK